MRVVDSSVRRENRRKEEEGEVRGRYKYGGDRSRGEVGWEL